jgi:plastocyanin
MRTEHRLGRERVDMNTIRRILLATVTLAAAIGLLASCSSGGTHAGSGSPSGPTVTLKSLMFMPAVLHVTAGTTVTWRNDEPITHTVTSGQVLNVDKSTGLRSGQHADGLFNATLKGSGDTFSYTFEKPGTYSYYCDIHQGMNAEVVVTK